MIVVERTACREANDLNDYPKQPEKVETERRSVTDETVDFLGINNYVCLTRGSSQYPPLPTQIDVFHSGPVSPKHSDEHYVKFPEPLNVILKNEYCEVKGDFEEQVAESSPDARPSA